MGDRLGSSLPKLRLSLLVAITVRREWVLGWCSCAVARGHPSDLNNHYGGVMLGGITVQWY